MGREESCQVGPITAAVGLTEPAVSFREVHDRRRAPAGDVNGRPTADASRTPEHGARGVRQP
jgi:hypothetical protein